MAPFESIRQVELYTASICVAVAPGICVGVSRDGTVTPRAQPVAVTALSNVGMIALSDGYVIAREGDSALAVCGRNDSGRLGDGTLVGRRLPYAIDG